MDSDTVSHNYVGGILTQNRMKNITLVGKLYCVKSSKLALKFDGLKKQLEHLLQSIVILKEHYFCLDRALVQPSMTQLR